MLTITQKWEGKLLNPTTLAALGQVTQLGHLVGNTCSHPGPLRDLMVFDLGGIHRIVVQYCECGHSPSGLEPYVQILRARWFPATLNRPSTAFTFRLLDFFQKLQNHSKCNPYDFYNTIVQQTNCAGLSQEIVRNRLPPTSSRRSNYLTVSLQRDYSSDPYVEPSQTPPAWWCRPLFRWC